MSCEHWEYSHLSCCCVLQCACCSVSTVLQWERLLSSENVTSEQWEHLAEYTNGSGVYIHIHICIYINIYIWICVYICIHVHVQKHNRILRVSRIQIDSFKRQLHNECIAVCCSVLQCVAVRVLLCLNSVAVRMSRVQVDTLRPTMGMSRCVAVCVLRCHNSVAVSQQYCSENVSGQSRYTQTSAPQWCSVVHGVAKRLSRQN